MGVPHPTEQSVGNAEWMGTKRSRKQKVGVWAEIS